MKFKNKRFIICNRLTVVVVVCGKYSWVYSKKRVFNKKELFGMIGLWCYINMFVFKVKVKVKVNKSLKEWEIIKEKFTSFIKIIMSHWTLSPTLNILTLISSAGFDSMGFTNI